MEEERLPNVECSVSFLIESGDLEERSSFLLNPLLHGG